MCKWPEAFKRMHAIFFNVKNIVYHIDCRRESAKDNKANKHFEENRNIKKLSGKTNCCENGKIFYPLFGTKQFGNFKKYIIHLRLLIMQNEEILMLHQLMRSA